MLNAHYKSSKITIWRSIMCHLKQLPSSTKERIIECLINHYQMRRINQTHYKYGICPSCQQKKLWAFADNPLYIQCDRENNCGYKASLRDLHPELFLSVTKRAKEQLPNDPKGVAKLYLQDVRGLNITRIGPFDQGHYQDPISGKSSPTVRFSLPNGGWWERLIVDIDNAPKNYIKPGTSYKNHAWTHQDFNPGKINRLWIVEGIFDALALLQNNIPAISTISCRNYPKHTLEKIIEQNPKINIIFAYDNDKAGRESIISHVQKTRHLFAKINVSAALPPAQKDWNDLHIKRLLSAKYLNKYYFDGALLIADSVENKAFLIYQRTKQKAFFFEFKEKTFWCRVDTEKIEETKQEIIHQKTQHLSNDEHLSECESFKRNHIISTIASCTFDFLYAERDFDTKDALFYLHLNQTHRSVKRTFTSTGLSSSQQFKREVINAMPGATFTGNTSQLDAIYSAKATNLAIVDTINYIGYCPQLEAYIFHDFAVKDGRTYLPNAHEYYEFGSTKIKSNFDKDKFHFSLTRTSTDWLNDFIITFGTKGITALSWLLGSLFAEQIRKKQASYPFLEITGELASGKSTLIQFLCKLSGRLHNHEGINPETSSDPAVSRSLEQVSNLPVIYLEGDTGTPYSYQTQKWLEESKVLYNGHAHRHRGIKNNNVDTLELPFRGALMFSQNASINASKAVLSRIIYIHFDLSHHTEAGRIAAKKIERYQTSDISNFTHHAITHENEILSLFEDRYEAHYTALSKVKGIQLSRIIHNHAQLLSLLDALSKLLHLPIDIKNQTAKYIIDIAIEREKSLQGENHMIDEFWHTYEFLASQSNVINHFPANKNCIAINLNQFYEVARAKRQSLPRINIIRRLLTLSKHYKFIENKSIKSIHSPVGSSKRIRCYIFQRPKDENDKENDNEMEVHS